MEYPEPTIDVDGATWDLAARRDGVGRDGMRALLAQAWEEGRWSPPIACMNPYGEPSRAFHLTGAGAPLARLRSAAEAALAWVENMAPTVRRTALANQLRAGLGLPDQGEK